MKVKKLIMKYYESIFEGNKQKEKRLWIKSLKKSLKGKHTEVIR